MRTVPIVLAAVGAISLLAASSPANAHWDDQWRPGWRERAWREHQWRKHQWREHHLWGYNNPYRYYHPYRYNPYRYGYNYSYGYPRY